MILRFKTWMEENVTVEDYRDILTCIPGTMKKNVPMLIDRRKEIAAANYFNCSAILSDYYTWFNCSVLKVVLKVAKTLTQKDPTEMLSILQSYTEEVHNYCKRNIFECPPPSCMSSTKGTTNFILKLEKHQVLDQKTFTAEEIILFEATLMTSLNIEQYVLKLCTVADGCVELVYSVPLCIYSVLFPLNEEQWKHLIALGVTEIITKDYHYNVSRHILSMYWVLSTLHLRALTRHSKKGGGGGGGGGGLRMAKYKYTTRCPSLPFSKHNCYLKAQSIKFLTIYYKLYIVHAIGNSILRLLSNKSSLFKLKLSRSGVTFNMGGGSFDRSSIMVPTIIS